MKTNKPLLFCALILLCTLGTAFAHGPPMFGGSPSGAASISDTAYNASSWDGVTTIGASKNAIRDKVEALQDLDADLTSYATPTAWRMFYSDAADPFHSEITLGANGTFLESNGASAAPAFRTLVDGDIPDSIAITNLSQVGTRPITGLTATNWRVFYSADGAIPVELALGIDGTFFQSSGTSSLPEFTALVAGDIPDISGNYEVQLNNEAGLYGVLSDVTQFYEAGDLVVSTVSVLDDSDIASDNISAAQAKRGVVITNDGKGGASDYNILPGVKGMVVYTFAEEPHVMTLDLLNVGDIIVLPSGAIAAGNQIDSDGNAGSSITLVCHEGTGAGDGVWYVHSQVGVWIDGGAD